MDKRPNYTFESCQTDNTATKKKLKADGKEWYPGATNPDSCTAFPSKEELQSHKINPDNFSELVPGVFQYEVMGGIGENMIGIANKLMKMNNIPKPDKLFIKEFILKNDNLFNSIQAGDRITIYEGSKGYMIAINDKQSLVH